MQKYRQKQPLGCVELFFAKALISGLPSTRVNFLKVFRSLKHNLDRVTVRSINPEANESAIRSGWSQPIISAGDGPPGTNLAIFYLDCKVLVVVALNCLLEQSINLTQSRIIDDHDDD